MMSVAMVDQNTTQFEKEETSSNQSSNGGGEFLSEEEYRKERIRQLKDRIATYTKMKKEEEIEHITPGRRQWYNRVRDKLREELEKLENQKEGDN